MDLQDNQVDAQIDTEEQSQSQQPEHQEKHKHANILAVVLFFLLLVFGGGGIYLALAKTQTEDQPISKEAEENTAVDNKIKSEEPEENIKTNPQGDEAENVTSGVIRTTEVLIERMESCRSYSAQEYQKQIECLNDIVIRIEDIELCVDMGGGVFMDMCISGFAVRNEDIDICHKYKIVGCYIALAEELFDATICKEISKEFQKEDCFSQVAVSSQDVDICENIKNQRPRELCYKDVAVAEKDSLLCEKIKEDLIGAGPGPSKISCNYAVAKATGNVELCGNPAPADVDKSKYWNYARENSECFEAVAAKLGDINICKKINNSSEEEHCYSGVAITLKDSSVCGMVTDQRTKDQCYMSIAPIVDNIELCEKIEAETFKKQCLNNEYTRDDAVDNSENKKTEEDSLDPELAIKKRDARRRSDIKIIMTALDLYYNDEVKYPDIDAFNNVLFDKYIHATLVSPEENSNPACVGFNNYKYSMAEGGNDYEIRYCLEKGMESFPAGINYARPSDMRSNATKVENSNTEISSETAMKIEFILLGEHNMYDVCYDHDTSTCKSFFPEINLRGHITNAELSLTRQTDPNNVGQTYHPNFSDAALNMRRDALNRYFDFIRGSSDKYKPLLDKIDCTGAYCAPSAVLDKNSYIEFIRF